jgi:bifunctional non-homologous end joining protein LigD
VPTQHPKPLKKLVCAPETAEVGLAQLLRGRAEGIFVAPFEQGEIGPELFEAACRMGLEGLVSKHRERIYRGGRSLDWIKVKNPAASGI